ncbi:DUF541 domain-containing protein, partial [candidate division WOR-3 bacterium]|nr:DUF541 domain-containing protein [candidate division WOR-3 bacterium]MBD3364187.1 DUF541 domain-containing protein [candidate division WOR-3 bacterium]
LKANEIASDDMQTTRYEVTEEYRYDEYGNPIKQEGYQVKHVLKVKVRNFAIVIPLTDQVLQAGATDIRDIRFTLEEPKNYMPELREKTLNAAEKKAAQMAEVAGFKLGKPVIISEFQPRDMPHIGYGGARFESIPATAYGSLNLEPGEIELKYNIYITYELL